MIPHSRPTVIGAEAEAVARVIASGQHAGGTERRAFEAELAARVGVDRAFAVQSGSAALHTALIALGVAHPQRVLLPSYVCVAVLNAVVARGAVPVLVDIDPHFLNVTEKTVLAALAREGLRERDIACAIVPHLFGFPVPLHRLTFNFPIIEDGAMALGARIDGEDVGSWGRIALFSFYATKMISTGQGGMLLTNDRDLAGRIDDVLTHDNRASWHEPSWNYRMPDLAAAIGRVQFGALDELLARRHDIATHYRDRARQLGIPTQAIAPETTPNHYRFVIFSDERERLADDLIRRGIEVKPPVFRPLHRYLKLADRDYPGTEIADRQVLSLPIYPSLSDEDRDRVVDALDFVPAR